MNKLETFEQVDELVAYLQPNQVSTRTVLLNTVGQCAVMEELGGGWELPGGGVRIGCGESVEQGGRREIEEEVGLTPERLLVIYFGLAVTATGTKATFGLLGRVAEKRPRIDTRQNPHPEHRRGLWLGGLRAVRTVTHDFDRTLLLQVRKNGLAAQKFPDVKHTRRPVAKRG